MNENVCSTRVDFHSLLIPGNWVFNLVALRCRVRFSQTFWLLEVLVLDFVHICHFANPTCSIFCTIKAKGKQFHASLAHLCHYCELLNSAISIRQGKR